MRLPRAGIEYATCPVTGGPEGATYEVAFQTSDDLAADATWSSMTTAGDGLSAKVLVAGPSAPAPGAAVVLPLGRVHAFVRLVSAPERIIRPSGVIDVD